VHDDFRFGSNSEVAAITTHVCSTLNNRLVRLERTRPFRANNGSARAFTSPASATCTDSAVMFDGNAYEHQGRYEHLL